MGCLVAIDGGAFGSRVGGVKGGRGVGLLGTLSPVNMELAPARNITACSMGEKERRPAERRTIERGMMMRAVAIARAISKTSGVSPIPSTIGVPSIGTSALIGTDSGCSGMVLSWWRRPMRSSMLSPMPRMPPQHTEIPAARTFLIVCSRSSYVRVPITFG